MPGLDFYYGADSCYVGNKGTQYPPIYKLTRRYKGRYSFEEAVFGVKSQTLILSLSERQKSEYQEYYFTPNERFHLLPPTLDASFSPITDRVHAKRKAPRRTRPAYQRSIADVYWFWFSELKGLIGAITASSQSAR